MQLKVYTETIKQLKSAILASRYKAATLANRELITLYFNVGKVINEKIKIGKWGDKVLEQLSDDLQLELPGLKGFSATNIKRMKSFYINILIISFLVSVCLWIVLLLSLFLKMCNFPY